MSSVTKVGCLRRCSIWRSNSMLIAAPAGWAGAVEEIPSGRGQRFCCALRRNQQRASSRSNINGNWQQSIQSRHSPTCHFPEAASKDEAPATALLLHLFGGVEQMSFALSTTRCRHRARRCRSR